MVRFFLAGLLGIVLPAMELAAAPVPRERPPNPLAWAYMGVRMDTSNTMRVSSAEPGTPAYYAGVQANDVIVRVGDLTPQSFDDVAVYIFLLRPGTRLTLEVRRGNELLRIPLVLGERPEDAPLSSAILERVFKQSPPQHFLP